MGCGPSHSAEKGVVNKNSKQAVRAASKNTNDKSDEVDADGLTEYVAGYVGDYPQKGTVTTYEDYRGFETSTTNHVSKNKVEKICKWADTAMADRQRLNHDVFFNPQNPAAWPKEVLMEHTSSPSFADRHSVQQSSYK